MHIVFITDEYPKAGFSHGGIGTMVYMLAHAMKAMQHSITILGINYETKDEDITEDGIRIIRLAKSTRLFFKFADHARRLNKTLKTLHAAHKIDIVESPELGLAFVKKIPDITWIIRMNGGHHFFTKFENRPREKKKVWMEKRSFSIADAFIGVSRFVYDTTVAELGTNKPHAIISNPVDTKKFAPDPFILPVENTLLFAGTLIEKKGVRQLVQAMPAVVKKYPDVKLHIYGRDWPMADGTSYTAFLKKQINGLDKNIIIHGAIDRNALQKEMLRAAICVFPSHMEAMPLVWLEALGSGKTIIGSNTGPGPEVIDHGKTGILVNPHEPAEIADAIINLLADKQHQQRLGVAARKAALQHFSVESVAAQSIAFYQQIQQNKQA